MPKKFFYPAKNNLRKLNKQPRLAGVRTLSKGAIQLIRLALKEDIGSGDITSNLLIPAIAKGKAKIISKAKGIFSGAAVAQAVCRLIDSNLKVKLFVKDSAALQKGQKVFEFSGKIRSILKAERVLLNFIGHLSGIATQTAAFVNAVRSTRCCILDTRKTTPLWRELEKAAVVAGGGFNHRFGLFDHILVKENHRHFGDWSRLVRISNHEPRTTHFEIEVRNFDELIQAFDLGVEVVMLDHFTLAQVKKAVQLRNRISPKTLLEVSGNMTLKTIRRYAQVGADAISVGALTHSVPVHDFSLLIGE